MKRKDKGSRVKAAAEVLPEQGRGFIRTDVLGSYTGNTPDGSRPVQDADDL